MLIRVRQADEGIARVGTEKFRKIADNIVRQARKIAADANSIAIEEARAEKLASIWEVLSSRPIAWTGDVEVPGVLLPTLHAIICLWIADAQKSQEQQLHLTVKPHDTEGRIDEAKDFLKRCKGELKLPFDEPEKDAAPAKAAHPAPAAVASPPQLSVETGGKKGPKKGPAKIRGTAKGAKK